METIIYKEVFHVKKLIFMFYDKSYTAFNLIFPYLFLKNLPISTLKITS